VTGFATPDRLANGARSFVLRQKKRLGLAELRAAVVSQLTEGKLMEHAGPVLINLRHHDALAKARLSVEIGPRIDACHAPAGHHCGRRPRRHRSPWRDHRCDLTNEEVLDRIFSEFCIGSEPTFHVKLLGDHGTIFDSL